MYVRNVLLFIIFLGFSLNSFAQIKQALEIDVPEKWLVEYKGLKNTELYVVSNKTPGNLALLMFSRYFMAGGKELAKETVDRTAKSVVEASKINEDVNLKSEAYQIQEINGKSFSGFYAKFEMEEGIILSTFVFTNGTEMWQGQYTGDAVNWESSLNIISKIKKKD